jgi:predicted transcriptional regulator
MDVIALCENALLSMATTSKVILSYSTFAGITISPLYVECDGSEIDFGIIATDTVLSACDNTLYRMPSTSNVTAEHTKAIERRIVVKRVLIMI